MIKKYRALDYGYIYFFCMELYLILKAGIPVGEGFLLMAENEDDPFLKELIGALCERIDQGVPVSEALRDSGAFPEHMISMVEIGEQTGYLESVWQSLAVYYEKQVHIARMIRQAVIYPAVLFIIMLVVVTVLVVQVLPIFNDVFIQLGSSMSVVALVFLNMGVFLNTQKWVILAIAMLLAVAVALVYLIPDWRVKFKTIYGGWFGGTKLGCSISGARFASAMAMGLSSGLDTDVALGLTEKLCKGTAAEKKVHTCREMINKGERLPEAIVQTGLLEPLDMRMFALGVKSGAADSVMMEIARRNEEKVNINLENLIGLVEPLIVVIMSVLIGLILISVMLPLMGIMSAIG